MRHPIDPKVDCVFKALLGAESNRTLLIHFLNSVLVGALPEPIAQVPILNPYSEREHPVTPVRPSALVIVSATMDITWKYVGWASYLSPTYA
jgi:hypothetical protein